MKRRIACTSLVLTVLVLSVMPMGATAAPVARPVMQASGWLSPWPYRLPITITNSGAALTNYQVRIALDNSFAYNHARSDGADLRVTDSTGTTLIPFWIESWTPPTSASIWVKAPAIPGGNTTLYLYYGNSGASSASNGNNTFEFFDDLASIGNPFFTTAGGGDWEQTFVSYPNIFKEGNTYTMVYDGHRPEQKGLATSSDLLTWTRNPNNPILRPSGITGQWDQAGLAWGDIIKAGGTYTVFTAGYMNNFGWSIGLETSTDLIHWNRTPAGVTNPVVTGDYNNWEGPQVSGPSILKELDGLTPVRHSDGHYWMTFHNYVNPTQIGLVYSSDLVNWTKYAGNPIITGTAAWEDGGVWVTSLVRDQGTYYLFYYGHPTSGRNYHMNYAYSNAATEFPATWHKGPGTILEYGPWGTWEDSDQEDPIVRKFGNTYYLFYTAGGGNAANGLATSTSITGTYTKLETNWIVTGTPIVDSSVVSLTAPTGLPGAGIQTFNSYSSGRALGFRALLANAAGTIKWGGFISETNAPLLTIGTVNTVDTTNLVLSTYQGGTRHVSSLGPPPGDYHIYEIAWLNSEGRAYIDHSTAPAGTLNTAIPSGPLPISFRNYNDGGSTLKVDWVYVRQFRDPEPTLSIGAPTAVTLTDFRPRRGEPNGLLWITLAGLLLGSLVWSRRHKNLAR